MSTDIHTVLLNEIMDISMVGDLKAQLDESAKQPGQLCLDASQVERIDAPSLQLLTSFYREMSKVGEAPRWESPSGAFLQAVRLLDLESHLGIEQNAG